MARKLLPAILVLSLALMACGININLPTVNITPGPTVTDEINVPLPSSPETVTNLSLAFGAGTLKVHPGSSVLVSGTATYNISDFKPTITVNGSTASIEQGNWKLNGIPNMANIKNDWDLSLGNAPIALTIQAGAYHAEYQFGGLSLTSLSVKDGAAQSKLDFDSPNASSMSLLHYETGASDVSLTNLGNANFSNLQFSSGAGNYTLDFSGTLLQDGTVTIQTGISNMNLVIPTGVPVTLTVEGGLNNITHDSNWTKNGNVYTQGGTGHTLNIIITIGAGNLNITH